MDEKITEIRFTYGGQRYFVPMAGARPPELIRVQGKVFSIKWIESWPPQPEFMHEVSFADAVPVAGKLAMPG